MSRIMHSALPHSTRIHIPRSTALYSSQRQPLDCPEIRVSADLETIQRRLSIKLAKKLLRWEFDPDRALALLSSIPASSSSHKYFLEVVARRLCRAGRSADAIQLLDSRIPFAAAETDFASLLITYGCASIPDSAVSAFKARIFDGVLSVSVLSFNALLSAFLRSGRHCEVPDLFGRISKEYGIYPDDVSYVILLKSVCMSGKTGDALAIIKRMQEEKRVSPMLGMYTTVLDSLYKERNLIEAERLWNEMVGMGFEPDIVAYNVRIGYHALRAETCKVLQLIAKMEKVGVKPNTITYNYLIVCHFGSRQIEDAKLVYKKIVSSNLCSLNAATFRIVLGGLCRGGDFEAGLEVFRDRLRNNNRVPDFKTLRVFVEGLVKDGKMDWAKAVVAQVRKRFPENLCVKLKKVEDELWLSTDGDKTVSLHEVTIS